MQHSYFFVIKYTMLRVNTAAIIQSAIALVVAITVADGIRESIRVLGGSDSAAGALGVRLAVTVLLLLAAAFVLNKCGDHLFVCGNGSESTESYKNTPDHYMECEGCSVHYDGAHPLCNACMMVRHKKK